jgi:hypothetical protein
MAHNLPRVFIRRASVNSQLEPGGAKRAYQFLGDEQRPPRPAMARHRGHGIGASVQEVMTTSAS